ncbi:MAG TPA: type 1 glutamine amidotransferase [Spirochaetia bacterium]|nr:type 1 glutamine amidotransferase [Spirochaetia bacterium]
MGLKAHWFHHVPFEGLGSIQGWLAEKRAQVSVTQFFAAEGPAFPRLDDVDLLIIMGGPMSVNNEKEHPWLREEKAFAAEAIRRGTPVLGICLGAQLIASALGAGVRPNALAEIGWHPVERVGAGGDLERQLPRQLLPFHWHGETFDLPPGARHIARSAACENQAFTVGDRVIALQYHLETTPALARGLVENCAADLVPGKYIQAPEQILGSRERFENANSVLAGILDALIQRSLVRR